MKGVPQKPDPRRAGIRVPIRVTLGEEKAEVEPREVQQEAEPLPRRMGITMAELENMGTQQTAQDVQLNDEVQWPKRVIPKPAEAGLKSS